MARAETIVYVSETIKLYRKRSDSSYFLFIDLLSANFQLNSTTINKTLKLTYTKLSDEIKLRNPSLASAAIDSEVLASRRYPFNSLQRRQK